MDNPEEEIVAGVDFICIDNVKMWSSTLNAEQLSDLIVKLLKQKPVIDYLYSRQIKKHLGRGYID